MKITITVNEMDLKKIQESGQVFRWRSSERGSLIISGEELFRIRKMNASVFEITLREGAFERIVSPYLDLGRDYACVRERCFREAEKLSPAGREFIAKALRAGEGLRILRQDPFEMLITFLISQRKNIPAISRAVETLCFSYGHPIRDLPEELAGEGEIYAFPTAEELSRASEEDLRACALGYRAPYVKDAVDRVFSGRLDLQALSGLPDEELISALREVLGVGAKVADCVALFGFGRCNRAPVDVWIGRAIERLGGENPFPVFGPDAGIVQQYVFYAMKHQAPLLDA